MHGRDIVGLGREGFLAIAPPFTGDILWEHLEILQKGKSVCFAGRKMQFSSILNSLNSIMTHDDKRRHEFDDFSSLYIFYWTAKCDDIWNRSKLKGL